MEVVEDDAARLQKMDTPDFDPSAVAYAETPVELPSQCRGTATITSEIPTRVQVAAKWKRGLVVLADRWDPGWRAYLDGRETRILRWITRSAASSFPADHVVPLRARP